MGKRAILAYMLVMFLMKKLPPTVAHFLYGDFSPITSSFKYFLAFGVAFSNSVMSKQKRYFPPSLASKSLNISTKENMRKFKKLLGLLGRSVFRGSICRNKSISKIRFEILREEEKEDAFLY